MTAWLLRNIEQRTVCKCLVCGTSYEYLFKVGVRNIKSVNMRFIDSYIWVDGGYKAPSSSMVESWWTSRELAPWKLQRICILRYLNLGLILPNNTWMVTHFFMCIAVQSHRKIPKVQNFQFSSFLSEKRVCRNLRPRKLRPRKLRPPNIFWGKALFSSFSWQCFLGEKLLDDCIQNSWEYNYTTIVKQFRPLSCLHLPVQLMNPIIFTKMWTFSLSSTLFASVECRLCEKLIFI